MAQGKVQSFRKRTIKFIPVFISPAKLQFFSGKRVTDKQIPLLGNLENDSTNRSRTIYNLPQNRTISACQLPQIGKKLPVGLTTNRLWRQEQIMHATFHHARCHAAPQTRSVVKNILYRKHYISMHKCIVPRFSYLQRTGGCHQQNRAFHLAATHPFLSLPYGSQPSGSFRISTQHFPSCIELPLPFFTI